MLFKNNQRNQINMEIMSAIQLKKQFIQRVKKCFQISAVVAVGLFSQGCAKNYIPSTNLDNSNFIHYFSPGRVTIYQNEQEITAPKRFIGLVEGESCQAKAHHVLPDEQDARTDARRNAYKINANGIVFTGCVLIETQALGQSNECVNTRVCYGKAFQIEPSEPTADSQTETAK